MITFWKRLALGVAALVCLSNICFAQTYKAVVQGRVVDESGRPVVRALVSLEQITRNGNDEFSYAGTAYTDKNGMFEVVNISSKKIRKRSLFISGPFPENALQLIHFPLDANLRRALPDLRASSITLTGNNSRNVGDVSIRVFSRVVEISVLRNNDRPLFQTASDWRSIFFVFRDETGSPLVAQGISIDDSQWKVDTTTGTIRFAVPEGKWSIEFISDLGNFKSVVARTGKFRIVRAGEPLKIRVALPDNLRISPSAY